MNDAMRLRPMPLAGGVFDAYGEVIEYAGDEPRRRLDAPFAAARADIRFGMTVNRLRHCADPIVRVNMLERHPYSPQSFIPLGGVTRSLIVVANSAPDGAMDLSTVRAFIAAPDQGVVYRQAVWHYAFTSIDDDAEVAVILGRTGQDDDTEYARLHVPIDVVLTDAGSVGGGSENRSGR